MVVRIDVPRVAQRLDAAREAALRAQARTPRRELPARLAAHAHRSLARGAVLINEAALHHAVLREPAVSACRLAESPRCLTSPERRWHAPRTTRASRWRGARSDLSQTAAASICATRHSAARSARTARSSSSCSLSTPRPAAGARSPPAAPSRAPSASPLRCAPRRARRDRAAAARTSLISRGTIAT